MIVLKNWLIPIFSLLAITLHFLIGVIELPDIYRINAADLPLILLILTCGILLIFKISFKLLKGDFGADLLAMLALISGAILSQYLAASLIILMLSGGEALENYAMRKASSVLNALAKRMPSIAHRKKSTIIEDISLDQIAIGDEIIIYPYETAPVDGIVIDGNGVMDESYLTGEPYSISKAIGSKILSGAINGSTAITLCAEKLPNDSRYAQIIKVMQDAEQKRPVIRRLGDQIGAIFTPISLIFAIAAWYFSGDSMRFLSVLVVATPCPLIIAIPVAIISTISLAAKRGIIIKDPVVLERLPKCKTAIFDKTGTLTYGKPELTEIIIGESNVDISKNDILQYAASIERYSKHPLAKAILKAANKENLILKIASNISEQLGRGLIGVVDNHEICITQRNNLLKESYNIISELPKKEIGLECIIIIDKKYAATFRFRDTPRAEGKSFIKHLKPAHQFNKIMLVSGDHTSEVNYLANLLGISEARGSQSPEDKVKIVKAETEKAPTLFMGDGINDAPALTSATVGIAFGRNSSITAEASGAVILENSLAKMDELIHLSIAMRRVALQSAIGGLGASMICMGFAATGYITPVIGSILQEVIDVLAIINVLRLTWMDNIEIDLDK